MNEFKPVAWLLMDGTIISEYSYNLRKLKEDGDIPLFTQRTWVGLTDGEWMNIVNKDHAWYGQRPDEVAHEVAKLVEAKLKEKNSA